MAGAEKGGLSTWLRKDGTLSFLLMWLLVMWARPGGPGVCRGGSYLASCSWCSFTAVLGEQQMVFLLGHLNSSVVSALPKQVKER